MPAPNVPLPVDDAVRCNPDHCHRAAIYRGASTATGSTRSAGLTRGLTNGYERNVGRHMMARMRQMASATAAMPNRIRAPSRVSESNATHMDKAAKAR
jgi:hypothetical protein